jgi:ABC-type amino acid transport system permease subunit
MNVGKSITKQEDFLGQGLIYESLIFVGVLFWVVSYVMSKESQRLEKRLGVGVR